MRIFLLFVALLAGALVAAAALTYPAWLAVSLVSIEPVHRVMHRVAMLFALIGLVFLTRRLGLANRAALGYGAPRPQFMRSLLLGWLGGAALMLPLVGLLLGLDVREARDHLTGSLLLQTLFAGLLSGLVVALIEETFFRGILFTAITRTSSIAMAVIAPSALYAALHFLGGKLRAPPEEVAWEHGWVVLAKLFERYAQPLEFADSFLALFTLGVLLSLVRHRTGNIAACIGLHAAGVCAIAVLREATVRVPTSSYSGLVGSYDGVIGWAALIWFALIAFAVARWRHPATHI